MVDEARVRRLLAVLTANVADLRRYAATMTPEIVREQRDAQHMLCHALYTASQAAIDLALHWVASSRLGGSQTYADAFSQLAAAGLIEPDLARRLASWAGLRNVLAHLYADLDPVLLHAALTDLPDLDAFAAAINAAL